jgi:hypothetical protein
MWITKDKKLHILCMNHKVHGGGGHKIILFRLVGDQYYLPMEPHFNCLIPSLICKVKYINKDSSNLNYGFGGQ